MVSLDLILPLQPVPFDCKWVRGRGRSSLGRLANPKATIHCLSGHVWSCILQAPLIIKNPHALPMYREEGQPTGGGRKRKVGCKALLSAEQLQPC